MNDALVFGLDTLRSVGHGDYAAGIQELIESLQSQLAAERERADGLQRELDAAKRHEWAPTGLIVGSSYQWRCWKCKAEALTEDQTKPNAGDCCLPSPAPAQPVAVPEVMPRSRLIRIDTVSNTVRIESDLDKPGKEKLSGLIPFDGTYAGLAAILSTTEGRKDE